MPRFVILFRAMNTGKRKAPMAVLREACRDAGFADVETYIQSGNLILSSDADAGAVETVLEALVIERFGFVAEAIARSAARWAVYAAGGPFPEAEAVRPKHVNLCLAKRPFNADVVDRLMERATLGERAVLAGDALWLDFVGGVGESMLTPAVIDKAAGSTVTARNWNTVLQLQAMVSRA